MRHRWIPILIVAAARAAHADEPRLPRVHALLHARVVVRPGKAIDDATIVLRDGVIEAVGRGIVPPADARVWDLSGRTVYAGLIEPWWDRSAPPRRGERRGSAPERPEPEPAARGAGHENALVHPEADVAASLALSADELDEMRAVGFALAHLVPGDGIWRGQSAIVALRAGPPALQLVRPHAAQVLAFQRNRGGPNRPAGYPNSIMGSVALVRQSLLDATWVRECEAIYAAKPRSLPRPDDNEALAALGPVLPRWGHEPVWVATEDVLDLLRAASVASEFGLDAVALARGDEYRRLDDVRATGLRLVVRVDFPEPPRFEDDDEALGIELETLQHWERAPANPMRLQAAGVPFAVTSQGLLKRIALRAKMRAAIERGWSADAALASLTTMPAQFLGLEKRLGTIEAGKQAFLTVTSGDLFASDTRVVEVWVDGDRYEVRPKEDPLDAVRGEWRLEPRAGAAETPRTLRIDGGSELTLQARLADASGERSADDVRLEGDALLLRFGSDRLRLQARERALDGTWTRADGSAVPVRAKRARRGSAADSEGAETGARAEAEAPAGAAPAGSVPGGGRSAKNAATAAASSGFVWPPPPPPEPKAVLVRGATIWTSGPQGRLEGADLLVVGGKIRSIGRGLRPPAGAQVIEAAGMHLSPGLIDCHSHSDIVGGVNEGSNTCTAEVRIADVLNSESIAIYRELAGGLTTANELHGSANSIGGQNAVIKLRWGSSPRGLLFTAAPPGIKFALGENPKQSNWGSEATGRYPQTRMGVEQSIRDRFLAARDYDRAWTGWKKGKGGKAAYPPRRDLQLEAVAQVLRGERLVHCHSYRADEILMLIRLAEQFGFRVATFQHVLEGYKVADEIEAHGAGGSCFSDWWAYKFEVYDAIPYAGAIMHDRGVVVSFNSDSSELARHLNLEAAKAVKYGGVPEEEALQFVTLNPAKQLRIDSRVGSLEPGKDADFILWSESPLSASTRCEQTWIEGRCYFDRKADVAARAAMEAERKRLVEAARAARKDKKGDEDETSGWRPTYWIEDAAASCHEGGQP